MFRSFKKAIYEYGIKNWLVGNCKKARYRILQKKYHFNDWHYLCPIEFKKYAQDVAQYISANTPISGFVVDVGCGLGELLKAAKWAGQSKGTKNAVGFDINPDLVKAATYLCKKKSNLEFRPGTFADVKFERPIDYLIALNFLHIAKEEKWENEFEILCGNNTIEHFIVDTVPEKESPEMHFLDFRKILPQGYSLIQRIGPYEHGSGRSVEIWKKLK